MVGGVSRAGTEHHDLCVGDLNLMRTDSKKLFQAGLGLALETWRDAAEAGFDWSDVDYFVAHQTSVVHIRAMAAALGVDESRFPLTLPTYGNIGPAAVPFTLAQHVDLLSRGHAGAAAGHRLGSEHLLRRDHLVSPHLLARYRTVWRLIGQK